MSEIHPKITYSIDQMISDAMLKMQYYGEFCQFINFKQLHTIKTCGVNINIHGMQYLYNKEFVDELKQEELNFIMIHEIFHLLWDHQARERRGGYEHELSNVVQDMIINYVIKTDIIDKMIKENERENRNLSFAKLPKSKKENETWVLLMPKEYNGKLAYEDLYEWMYGERKKYNEWKAKCNCDKSKKCKCNRIDGTEKCDCEDCPVSDYLRRIFDQLDMGILDFLDSHLPSDMPEEYRKSIIENVKNNLRSRGLETADILATLNKITKSKKDYIKNIKIGINELFGIYKQKSITKRNRRSIPGIKGKRKESWGLNVILDVSGSMEGYFEKALSYIFQNDIKINLVQCDTKVKSHTVIKSKREFRKIQISGLGGTEIQPGVDYISTDRKLNKMNTLILTDGLCGKLDVTKLKRIMIISHVNKVKIIGEAKQIIIKD